MAFRAILKSLHRYHQIDSKSVTLISVLDGIVGKGYKEMHKSQS